MTTLIGQLTFIETAGLVQVTPTQSELVYSFRHALIQEAAYLSLTNHQRRDLHRLVAEALEAVYPTRLPELSNVLAYHFTLARLTGKAVIYARQAARRAMALHAHEEARELLQAALALFAGEEATPDHLALLEDMADVLRLMRQGRSALTLYEQVLELGARGSEARPAAVRLHRKVLETAAEIHWSIPVEAYAQLTAAVEASRAGLQADMALPEHPAPDAETARLLAALSTYAWNVQSPVNWPAALQYARAAVEVAEQLSTPAVLAAALGTLAAAEFGNGQLRAYEAVAQRRLTLCLAESFDDPHERLDALRDAGSARMYVGQYRRALEALTEAEALARQVHAVDQQFNALSLQSQCWFRLDQWDEMLRIEAQWKGLDERYGGEQIGLTCFAVALGAIARARRGDLETARARRQTSYALMVANTGPPQGWYRNQHY